MTSAVRPADEAANAITHGVGFLLSLFAGGYLMQQVDGRSWWVVVACGVYAASLLMVYGSSTLSHLFYDLAWRKRFRELDQACIFLLIAGTYTPFAAMELNGQAWRGLLFGMWGLAGFGIWRVIRVRDLPAQEKVFYGVVGCLPAIALWELSQQAPAGVVFWIIAGGVSYLIGTLFLRRSAATRYAHAIWHLCVIAGSACHYWAILLVVWNR